MIALTEKYTEGIELFDDCMIMCGRFACTTLTATEEASPLLNNRITAVFTDISPFERKSLWDIFLRKTRKNLPEFFVEPNSNHKDNKTTAELIDIIKDKIITHSSHGIIVIGGEELINACKAAIICIENNLEPSSLIDISLKSGDNIFDITPDKKNKPFNKKCSLICIPSTPCAFDKLTPFIKIFHKKQNVYKYVMCADAIPDALILDPDFTFCTDNKQFVSNSLDALGLAIESFLTFNPANNADYINLWALHCIEILTRYLPEFELNPDDADTRERLLTASAFASMTLRHTPNLQVLFLNRVLTKERQEELSITALFPMIWKDYLKDAPDLITERTLKLKSFFKGSKKTPEDIIKAYKHFAFSIAKKFSLPFAEKANNFPLSGSRTGP